MSEKSDRHKGKRIQPSGSTKHKIASEKQKRQNELLTHTRSDARRWRIFCRLG